MLVLQVPPLLPVFQHIECICRNAQGNKAQKHLGQWQDKQNQTEEGTPSPEYEYEQDDKQRNAVNDGCHLKGGIKQLQPVGFAVVILPHLLPYLVLFPFEAKPCPFKQ